MIRLSPNSGRERLEVLFVLALERLNVAPDERQAFGADDVVRRDRTLTGDARDLRMACKTERLRVVVVHQNYREACHVTRFFAEPGQFQPEWAGGGRHLGQADLPGVVARQIVPAIERTRSCARKRFWPSRQR